MITWRGSNECCLSCDATWFGCMFDISDRKFIERRDFWSRRSFLRLAGNVGYETKSCSRFKTRENDFWEHLRVVLLLTRSTLQSKNICFENQNIWWKSKKQKGFFTQKIKLQTKMQKFEGASEMISSLFLSREVHENRKENLLKIDGKNKKEKISAARFAQLISRWLSIKETMNLFICDIWWIDFVNSFCSCWSTNQINAHVQIISRKTETMRLSLWVLWSKKLLSFAANKKILKVLL